MATINFKGKRSEINELKKQLASTKMEERIEAIQKVIAAMTIGKDVSELFFPVLKCVETDHLQLKKLVYLYIINYAKTQPDLAVLAVNTFRKDSREKLNPLIRGLAVRTMGCIGIEAVLDYLIEPLKDSMNDEDPYVRKTAALCVSKIFDISPERAEDFMPKLIGMISDGNGMVVSNAIAALTDIQNTKGAVVQMNQDILHKLLNAIPECSEWGRVYILDFLAENVPSKFKDIDETIQRIIPNLAHSNCAVVLSATKVILKYMDFVQGLDKIRSICRKLAPPLISLMGSDPEIQYIAIRNINLIIQKRPYVLDKEIKVFFCNYQDPLYVKIEKLEIMIKLVDLKNVDQLLLELKDYSQEVDVQFVRKSISAIGRVAIKLEKAADRCIQVLHELIKTKIDYVVQESIIVIKDIFRKYPNRYEGIIKDLCENLKALDNAEARASMIWIIGQYCELIDNSIPLMTDFAENFKEESKNVQLAILNASVKIYLKLEGEAEDLITQVLQQATDESDNPDLRNRGYIYWRMLSENPQEAKEIILCEKPAISEDSGHIEPQLLDKLIDNISMLSSVYYKPPENFVKKIRDRINERLDLENDDLLGGHQQKNDEASHDADYEDSMGIKKSDYIKDSGNVINDYNDLIIQDSQDDILGINKNQNAIDDLLGGQNQNNKGEKQSTDLIDALLDIGSQNNNQNQEYDQNYNFLPIPFKPLFQENQAGSQTGTTGFKIDGAFARSARYSYHLNLRFTNNTGKDMTDFLIKINNNIYGIQVEDAFPNSFYVANNSTVDLKLKCSVCKGNINGQVPQGNVLVIQAGVKNSVDLFYFQFPVLIHSIFDEIDSTSLNKHQLQIEFNQVMDNPKYIINLQQISPQISNPQLLIQRFLENHFYHVSFSQLNDGAGCFLFYSKTPKGNDEKLFCEIKIKQGVGVQVNVKTLAQDKEYLCAYMLSSVSFILNARI